MTTKLLPPFRFLALVVFASVACAQLRAANAQTIIFSAIPNHTVGDAPFTLSPTTSSGLAVSLAVVSGPATLSGNTVTMTGTGTVTLQATQAGDTNFTAARPVSRSFIVAAAGTSAPVVTLQPTRQSMSAGGSVTFTAAADGTPAPTVQWTFNGVAIPGATSASLTVSDVQPAKAGIYRATFTNSAGSAETVGGVLAFTGTSKITGDAKEVASDVMHPNGNIYDQILLTGPVASVQADHGQVTRVSFVDLNNDIVQVEFSGSGTLTIALDDASGPAPAQNYNQPNVAYMKGNARLVIDGAEAISHVAVFTVGRLNAVDQSLIRNDVTYDGVADIASLTIHTLYGQFGGVHAGNTSFLSTNGYAGLYAPGVNFDSIDVGDLNAADAATPVFTVSTSHHTEIKGGDFLQANDRWVEVGSMTIIHFEAGMKSDGTPLPARHDQGRFENAGADTTAYTIVSPDI
ncbi:MAG TPA: immunoglobulin domain-containing protein [Opitutaceae bacterium]|nr:immunoglobulin domain-containing protein [Opitutaceae bacterium]